MREVSRTDDRLLSSVVRPACEAIVVERGFDRPRDAMVCPTPAACYSAFVPLCFRIWPHPAGAMGAILDRGSLLFASAAVLAATLLLKFTAPGLPISFFTPLLVLAVVYVPGTLLLATLLGRLGGVGVVFQRDYSPLLTCAAMAFAAAEIPLALAAFLVPVGYLLIAAVLYFALLMFFAV